MIGAVGLMYKNAPGALSGANWYALFVVAATICYGITANEVKNKLQDLDGTVITALGFMFVGPWAGIYLLFSDFSPALETPHYLLNLGFITILALFSSVIALIIFNTLIKYTTTLFATSVTYIIPIFAIFWGVFDGEKLSLVQFTWIAVILFGIFLVNAGPPRGPVRTGRR
ncbi:MAG: DMT family transporter [Candidatus Aminicenantes bacterium]|nr:DMT family transporter [Candidatus Aminicenantes bacterium]